MAGVLEERAELHFALEAFLCFEGYGHQWLVIFAPVGNTAVVGASALIADDEWGDAVTQAFLHHDQATNSAVVIFKGMDPLEADMEVQDTFHVNRAFLVFLQESGQRGDDIFVWDANLGSGKTELTGAQVFFTVGIGSICKDMVQFFDKSLRQRRGNIAHAITDGGKVIDCLDDVVHLHRLKGRTNLIGAVYLLNFVSCQPVACHTVGGVGQVHLDVLIDAVVIILASLIYHALGKGGERFFFHFDFGRAFC